MNSDMGMDRIGSAQIHCEIINNHQNYIMANQTNEKYWAAKERLRFIESYAWWKGVVQRQDLQETFGLSLAQASSDLQYYLEMNPSALSYNMRKKRYEASDNMKCMLTVPCLDDAISRFFGASMPFAWPAQGDAVERVSVVSMPVRAASPVVERKVFIAVLNTNRIKIKYASLNSGKDDWRWIVPHAFGHDGSRWHVRAWCEQNQDYRDFVLSRITDVSNVKHEGSLPVPDKEWQTEVTLKVKPNSALTEEQQKMVERDYGMTKGVLKLKVSKAMEGYVRQRLGLPLESGAAVIPLLQETK